MFLVSEDGAPGSFTPMSKERRRPLGLHAMSAHAHSWWLIIERKGGEIMKEKVEEALKLIRPMLQGDGGDVELVDVIDGVVKVRLKGACSG